MVGGLLAYVLARNLILAFIDSAVVSWPALLLLRLAENLDPS
jgi:hypothetical protein